MLLAQRRWRGSSHWRARTGWVRVHRTDQVAWQAHYRHWIRISRGKWCARLRWGRSVRLERFFLYRPSTIQMFSWTFIRRCVEYDLEASSVSSGIVCVAAPGQRPGKIIEQSCQPTAVVWFPHVEGDVEDRSLNIDCFYCTVVSIFAAQICYCKWRFQAEGIQRRLEAMSTDFVGAYFWWPSHKSVPIAQARSGQLFRL